MSSAAVVSIVKCRADKENCPAEHTDAKVKLTRDIAAGEVEIEVIHPDPKISEKDQIDHWQKIRNVVLICQTCRFNRSER